MYQMLVGYVCLTHMQLTTLLNTRGNHNREGERDGERKRETVWCVGGWVGCVRLDWIEILIASSKQMLTMPAHLCRWLILVCVISVCGSNIPQTDIEYKQHEPGTIWNPNIDTTVAYLLLRITFWLDYLQNFGFPFYSY